jgi:type IV pilus assembly protein PilX
MNIWSTRRDYHRGMALVVSLVLLLSLTLLGLAAIQNTTLQERMAGNMRSENIALQAAETALRGGEAWLSTLTTVPEPQNSGGYNNGTPEIWLLAFVSEDGNTRVGPYSVIPATGNAWWQNWGKATWETYGDGYYSDLPSNLRGDALSYVAAVQATTAQAGAAARTLSGAETMPRFVIEEVGYKRDHLVVGQQQDWGGHYQRYQITARGVDAAGKGDVLLQSRFVRRF